jgi:hypothetical protein
MPELTAAVGPAGLRALDELNRTLHALGGDTFIPKGVYRFEDHVAANEHRDDCIARGMARRGLKR